jgi:hypothetical protein
MDLEFPTSGLFPQQYETNVTNLTGAYGINSSSPILDPHAEIKNLQGDVNLFDEKFKSLIRSHTKNNSNSLTSSRNVLHNNGEFTFLNKDYLGKPQPKQVYYQKNNNVS